MDRGERNEFHGWVQAVPRDAGWGTQRRGGRNGLFHLMIYPVVGAPGILYSVVGVPTNNPLLLLLPWNSFPGWVQAVPPGRRVGHAAARRPQRVISSDDHYLTCLLHGLVFPISCRGLFRSFLPHQPAKVVRRAGS